MKALFVLLSTLLFSVFATPNSIIAIVNDTIITTSDISTQINKKITIEEKLALIHQYIDVVLQKEKIRALGIKPKKEAIKKVLNNIASQNGLTFKQLRANNKFEQISEAVTQDLSLRALKQIALQQASINITQAEFDKIFADNPKKADVTEEEHLANIEAKIVNAKQVAFFQNWVKNLRKGAYIEIFKDKLK